MAVQLLAQPWCQVATLALLHFLWQGLLVAAALSAAVQLLGIRRPGARYAASLAALVAMVASPLLSMAWLLADLGGERSLAVQRPAAFAELSAASTNLVLEVPLSELMTSSQPWLLCAWLAGVALFACRLLMGLVGVRLLLRGRLPLPRELVERADVLKKRLGMRLRPAICLSRRVSEAMAVGLLRPVVLIPAAWASEMPLAMLEAVLAHELAHLQRRDLWINLLQRLVETLLFYHPAVWWLSRRLRLERELCCDELAVSATGRRLEYVQALETVARREARAEPLFAAGIRGERDMQLLTRVRTVLGLSATGDRWRLWPAGLIALALPLGVWASATGLVSSTTAQVVADDDRKEDDDDRDEEDDDGDEKEGRQENDRDDDRSDKDDDDRGDKDDGDWDEKEGREKGDRERDHDDDDGDKRKPGKQEKEGDDEGEDRQKALKKGDREQDDDDGEGKDVRKGDRHLEDAERSAIRRTLEYNKEYGAQKERGRKEASVVRKEGKDGQILEIQIRGEEDGVVADLKRAVMELSAENHRLRAQLAEVLDQRSHESKKPGKPDAAHRKHLQSVLDEKLKESSHRKKAELRDLEEREIQRLRKE